MRADARYFSRNKAKWLHIVLLFNLLYDDIVTFIVFKLIDSRRFMFVRDPVIVIKLSEPVRIQPYDILVAIIGCTPSANSIGSLLGKQSMSFL